jgi:arsenate reductase (glutaredoxin)
MIIYYNPECSKCNEALGYLNSNNCEIEIRNYLTDPPTENELKELLQKLDCKAIDLVRQTEPLFIEKYSGRNCSDEEWIHILAQNPILIQRPIIVDGKKAIIGRPPTLVLELIK